MNAIGTVQSASAVGFETLYAGYRFDGNTPQMYYVRNRFLLPMVGTWNRRDPLGYLEGMSLSQYAKSSPAQNYDTFGLCCNPGGDYCGPNVDSLLAAELNYALRFWSKHIAYWSENLARFAWYRSVVRWRHMAQIGLQLDWTTVTSKEFIENGRWIICPTGKCKNTYMLCGVCVHDHFIGNIMFGYWLRLHGFLDFTANTAGHIAQLVLPTDERGFDKPWDKAGYELGRLLAESGKNFSKQNICSVLLGDKGNAYSYFILANNKQGANFGDCKPCPEEMDGGLKAWTKEINMPYPDF